MVKVSAIGDAQPLVVINVRVVSNCELDDVVHPNVNDMGNFTEPVVVIVLNNYDVFARDVDLVHAVDISRLDYDY